MMRVNMFPVMAVRTGHVRYSGPWMSRSLQNPQNGLSLWRKPSIFNSSGCCRKSSTSGMYLRGPPASDAGKMWSPLASLRRVSLLSCGGASNLSTLGPALKGYCYQFRTGMDILVKGAREGGYCPFPQTLP